MTGPCKSVLDNLSEFSCFRESWPAWLAVDEFHEDPEVVARQILSMDLWAQGLSIRKIAKGRMDFSRVPYQYAWL